MVTSRHVRFRSARRDRGAFTLIEAVVAMAVTVIAGSALLLGIHASLQATGDSLEQVIAQGMAEQLMDEVLGARYSAVGEGGHAVNLGQSSYESSGPGRQRYNDIDDYNGVRTQPPEDLWGIRLGADDGEGDVRHPAFIAPPAVLDDWRQEIDVYYVDPNDLSRRLPYGQVSDYRAVEVRIYRVSSERGRRELARLRRVVAYVPPLS